MPRPCGGGVHLVDLLGTPPLSQMIDSTNVNGNPAWQLSQVTFEQTDASAPAVTMNNGSLNIADIQSSGNLNFYWQASSGQFFAEVVDNSGTL
jgi:hypothetical protein